MRFSLVCANGSLPGSPLPLPVSVLGKVASVLDATTLPAQRLTLEAPFRRLNSTVETLERSLLPLTPGVTLEVALLLLLLSPFDPRI